MKDTKEIVLFFANNTKYNALDVAKELLSRYEELGNPVILPESEDKRRPLIIFNTNTDFQIEASLYTFNIVVKHKYFEKISTIIFDIVDAFSEFKCDFYRIGYISNVFLSPKYVDKAKKRYLNETYLEGINDYNLSWYKKLETNDGEINAWERLITDRANFSELLCQYDFNTPHKENVAIDMKFIKEFLHVTDEYIEQRTDY